jgi:DNA-binding GntR family transcriptional regulator
MLDRTLLVLFSSQFRPWLPAGTIRPAIDDHVRVIEAIEREDARAAEVAMRRHILDARQAVEKLPDDAFGTA